MRWPKARPVETRRRRADIRPMMAGEKRTSHIDARLRRQIDRLAAKLPVVGGWLRGLQSRRAMLIRVPLALMLIAGGLVSFLPVLGLWMLPLGLMLLAIDVRALRGPVSGWIIRIRRWWALRQRRR